MSLTVILALLYIAANAQSFNGDLPMYSISSSGHQSYDKVSPYGKYLNSIEIDEIVATAKFTAAIDFIAKLDAVGAYNAGQSPEQKLAGAYLALITSLRFFMVNPNQFDDGEDKNPKKPAGAVYGGLKLAALDKKDAKAVRDIIARANGKTFGLSDTQLIALWSYNEHHNLHAVLFGNKAVCFPIHVTSLNDKSNDRGDNTPVRTFGGYNDNGHWPQWDWLKYAKNYNNLLQVQPPGNTGSSPPSTTSPAPVPSPPPSSPSPPPPSPLSTPTSTYPPPTGAPSGPASGSISGSVNQCVQNVFSNYKINQASKLSDELPEIIQILSCAFPGLK